MVYLIAFFKALFLIVYVPFMWVVEWIDRIVGVILLPFIVFCFAGVGWITYIS